MKSWSNLLWASVPDCTKPHNILRGFALVRVASLLSIVLIIAIGEKKLMPVYSWKNMQQRFQELMQCRLEWKTLITGQMGQEYVMSLLNVRILLSSAGSTNLLADISATPRFTISSQPESIQDISPFQRMEMVLSVPLGQSGIEYHKFLKQQIWSSQICFERTRPGQNSFLTSFQDIKICFHDLLVVLWAGIDCNNYPRASRDYQLCSGSRIPTIFQGL